MSADRSMLATARAVQRSKVKLSQDVPVGDAACMCPGVDAPTPVHLAHEPKIIVGGEGMSPDTFSDHALPCMPGGGDIAGCEPCILLGSPLDDAASFASRMPRLADPTFVAGFLQPP